MNLYIGDTHFGHANIIRFDGRPFKDVEEMDRELIRLWNETVSPDDTVRIDGDLAMSKAHSFSWYFSQLPGHKILITGNHDKELLRDKEARKFFDAIKVMDTVYEDGRKVVICHYPIIEWDGKLHGAWHIYGHIHNNIENGWDYIKTQDHMLNAGCMINGYKPVTFKELIVNNEKFKKEVKEKVG